MAKNLNSIILNQRGIAYGGAGGGQKLSSGTSIWGEGGEYDTGGSGAKSGLKK